MKAVDFVVEFTDRVSFIEIKDPEHPCALSKDSKQFIKDFRNERLDNNLYYKFRDSFLYEWACDRTDKPIDYWILIASKKLTKVELGRRTDAMKSKLPMFEALPESLKKQWKQKSLPTVEFSISVLGTRIFLIIP